MYGDPGKQINEGRLGDIMRGFVAKSSSVGFIANGTKKQYASVKIQLQKSKWTILFCRDI